MVRPPFHLVNQLLTTERPKLPLQIHLSCLVETLPGKDRDRRARPLIVWSLGGYDYLVTLLQKREKYKQLVVSAGLCPIVWTGPVQEEPIKFWTRKVKGQGHGH